VATEPDWTPSKSQQLEEFLSGELDILDNVAKKPTPQVLPRMYGDNGGSSIGMSVVAVAAFLPDWLKAQPFQNAAHFAG
jgi:hypothetical protein